MHGSWINQYFMTLCENMWYCKSISPGFKLCTFGWTYSSKTKQCDVMICWSYGCSLGVTALWGVIVPLKNTTTAHQEVCVESAYSIRTGKYISVKERATNSSQGSPWLTRCSDWHQYEAGCSALPLLIWLVVVTHDRWWFTDGSSNHLICILRKSQRFL